jgi:hypothetical protein
VPAISLSKVEETAPALVSLYKSAGVSLRKHGLDGQRAAVYLVVDYSGSMKPYYKDGSVQALADRVLGLSAHLDDDGTVPVVFFSTDVDAVTDIALADHEGRIERIVFQTDGGPINKLAAERYVCKAARLPMFWQFVGFGDRRSKQFEFLRRLDELAVPQKRPIDNAGFFHAGSDPLKLTDAELYDRLVGEFPQWLAAAREQGFVR